MKLNYLTIMALGIVITFIGAYLIGNAADNLPQTARYGLGFFTGGIALVCCSYGWLLRSEVLKKEVSEDINT